MDSFGEDISLQCLQAYVTKYLSLTDEEFETEKKSGKFLSLPFHLWLKHDSGPYEEYMSMLRERGIPITEPLLASFGAVHLSESLKERLLGPSRPDGDLPSLGFERHNISYGREYEMGESGLLEKALKGMIAAFIQCYMFKYLCEPCELISSFNHPASKQELSAEKRLAIGVMREVLILPRFGSMQSFWLEHARMIEEGGKLIGLPCDEILNDTEVLELLKDDPQATAMYQLCLDVGMPKEDFYMFTQVFYYWS